MRYNFGIRRRIHSFNMRLLLDIAKMAEIERASEVSSPIETAINHRDKSTTN